MSKARVVVLEVTSGHLTVTAAARTYGLSRQHIYRLLKRYQLGGLDAVDPRSRRPVSNPRKVSNDVVAAVVLLREQLSADGLDAGPLTLQAHLADEGLPVPSTSTIRRILHHHGLIEPQPRKRPKSSYIRFAAEQPCRLREQLRGLQASRMTGVVRSVSAHRGPSSRSDPKSNPDLRTRSRDGCRFTVALHKPTDLQSIPTVCDWFQLTGVHAGHRDRLARSILCRRIFDA
jgi:transposase